MCPQQGILLTCSNPRILHNLLGALGKAQQNFISSSIITALSDGFRNYSGKARTQSVHELLAM
jgi:hypothetical protein